jgi:long-subunit acyl-CoA synthetase (AMP-forming)
VSVTRLEATYISNSPLIEQMYIYGSGLYSYLLAVVVPSAGGEPLTNDV